jgi:hypothetical protein
MSASVLLAGSDGKNETMPTLDEDGWELESAEERNVQYPHFQIPDREERANLGPGRRVKLLFLFLDHSAPTPLASCERMWVTITGVRDSQYVGVLESMPSTSEVLKEGDVVEFDPEHIAAIMIPKTDPRHPD